MTRGLGIQGEVLAALRCPVCGNALERRDSTVRCENGHAFDVARQGHLTLRTGEALPANADTSSMVEARERFLARGHYAPIAARLAELVREHEPPVPGLVVDLAGGTGYYLAAALDRMPRRNGLCVELSSAALQRAARAHERASAIGSDLRRRLPLADGTAAVALSVFGPRNIPEIRRVLLPGGLLAVVTPTVDHLRELIEPLGMIRVEREKPVRLAASLAQFDTVADHTLAFVVELDHDDLVALVSMGPSAHHLEPSAISARVAALPASVAVTVSVQLSLYRR